tara:strand:+ start:602 stop:808 length:207 start_codon:yes stop_codon:yes gene_type:complete
MILNTLQAQILTTAIESAYEGKKDIELNDDGLMLLAETQAYLVSKILPVNKNDIQESIKDRMLEHKNK